MQYGSSRLLRNQIRRALKAERCCCGMCSLFIGLISLFVLGILGSVSYISTRRSYDPEYAELGEFYSRVVVGSLDIGAIMVGLVSMFGILAVFNGKRLYFLGVQVLVIIEILILTICLIVCVVIIFLSPSNPDVAIVVASFIFVIPLAFNYCILGFIWRAIRTIDRIKNQPIPRPYDPYPMVTRTV